MRNGMRKLTMLDKDGHKRAVCIDDEGEYPAAMDSAGGWNWEETGNPVSFFDAKQQTWRQADEE